MATKALCQNIRHVLGVLTISLSFASQARAMSCQEVFEVKPPTSLNDQSSSFTRPASTDSRAFSRNAITRTLLNSEIPNFVGLQKKLDALPKPPKEKSQSSRMNSVVYLPDKSSLNAKVERTLIQGAVGDAGGSRYYEKTTYRRGSVFVEKHEIKDRPEIAIPSEVIRELKKINFEDWKEVADHEQLEIGYEKGRVARNVLGDLAELGDVRYTNLQYLDIASDRAKVAGRKKLDENLGEILRFSLAEYAARRNWSADFVDKLIAKAYSGVMDTDYVVVREATDEGLPGKIIGTIGYTRSTYAQYRYFSSKTNRWEERLNSLETAYLPNHNRKLSTKDAYFTTDLTVLPMEEFFGPRYELPRPGLVDFVHDGKGPLPSVLEDAVGAYMKADTSKPFAVFTGQILEPVKFAIDKDAAQRKVGYSAILLELFGGVFSSNRPFEFNAQAQRLYTYNTSEGVAMYKRMGFEEMASQWSHKDREGVQWSALELSPKKMMQTITSPGFMNGRIAKDFVEEFENSIGKVLESQKP